MKSHVGWAVLTVLLRNRKSKSRIFALFLATTLTMVN